MVPQGISRDSDVTEHRRLAEQPVPSASNKTFFNTAYPRYQHKNFIQKNPTFLLPVPASFVVLFLTFC
jgi:hypothetical protein